MDPFVSIIVPTKDIDAHVLECVAGCAKLEYPRFEVIVVSDSHSGPLEGARVLTSGPVPPGAKRNLGARAAQGDVLAFIDADAYPRPDWLRNAVRRLQEEGVGAVGGPGVTPPNDPPVAQVSGLVLGSFMMGGNQAARYQSGKSARNDDIPSCNFVAWRKVIEQAGGWTEKYWPGEDTLICRAIALGGHDQILDADVLVYHHRRASWRAHVRQVWNYAIHRGFFAKRFPETSRRAKYFAPSALVVGFVFGPLAALAFPPLWIPYAAAMLAYLALCAVAALKTPKYRAAVFVGILITHAVYGVGVGVGLSKSELIR